MRVLTLFGLGLATCLPQLVMAASIDALSAHALREECSVFSQAGMRDCLANKSAESEKTLRQAEEYMVDVLSKWDEDDKYVSLARTKIAISRKEFARYRKAQCEFWASLSGGGAGNAYEMGRLACVAELNGRRAEQLRDAAANLTMK